MLQLAIGLQQGPAVPEPHVGQGALGALEIGGAELLFGLEIQLTHGLEAKGPARRRNGAPEIGGLQLQLPGLHPDPLHQGCQTPLHDRQQAGGRQQGQHRRAAKPGPGHRHQQAQATHQQQQGQQQPQGKTNVQVNKASPRSHPTAFDHQVKGTEAVTQGRHQGQDRQLRLQHPLLLAAQPWKAQIGE